MASNEPLETRIAAAQVSLNKAFGTRKDQEGEGANRFLNQEALAAAYKEEASSEIIIKQFLSIAKSVRAMRSSYLPIEFFISDDTGRFDVDVSSTVSEMESYENTFMRMMGMPSVGSSEFGLSEQDSEIRSSETLLIVDPSDNKQKSVSFEEVFKLVLTERQKTKKTRRIVIDNSIYNISESSAAELAGDTISIRGLKEEEKADLLGISIVYDPKTYQLKDLAGNVIKSPTILELDETGNGYFEPITGIQVSESTVNSILVNTSESEMQASITSIEKDLWKFSYLLLPPIQDISISKCINEADKIVAPPFSNSRTRRVNNSKVRPTLLESVIRIRLDKVSGTDSITASGVSEVEENTDSFGVLESLFVLRLRSAISGLAHKLYSDIDIIIDEMMKSRRTPISEDPDNGNDIPDDNNLAGDQFKGTEDEAAGAITEEALSSLEQQKLIEDSILFLLGDNSEALDLQSQTQRSSTIHDAHMMSGLISIIDVPRQRIEFEVDKIIQSRNDCSSSCVEQKTQEIGVVLGTDIGIGTIDVAVFALAMFTLSEKSLLGLLSTSQFEKIKNGEFKALLPGDGEKESTVVALNEFSQLIIDGYNLFISDLESSFPLD